MVYKEKDFLTYIISFIGTPFSILAHTGAFVGIFILFLFGINLDRILLILTTLVSLEAIYLTLFIQATVNRQFKHIKNIGKDTDDILADTAELTEDEDEKV